MLGSRAFLSLFCCKSQDIEYATSRGNFTATGLTLLYADNSNSNNFMAIQNTAYTLSLNNHVSSSLVRFYVRRDSDDTKSIDATCTLLNRAVTVTPGAPYIANRCFIYISAGATLSNFTLRPQLELGSTVTTYELPKSNKLTVSGLPMNSLLNGVWDEIVRNTDGSYKHIQREYSSKYIGNEPWSFRNNGDGNTTVSFTLTGQGTMSSSVANFSADNSRCSHFKSELSSSNGIIGYNNGAGTTGEIFFEVPRSILTGFSDVLTNTQKTQLWKDYLSTQNATGTPVHLQAPLAAPVETPLPSSYKLTSYKGVTNVFTTAPVQPVLTADFKSRLKNTYEVLIQKIMALTNAIITMGGTINV